MYLIEVLPDQLSLLLRDAKGFVWFETLLTRCARRLGTLVSSSEILLILYVENGEKIINFPIHISTRFSAPIGGNMREEDSSTDSDQENSDEEETSTGSENNLNTLRKLRNRIEKMDDHSDELMEVGFVMFVWSGLFFFLNLIFGWMGFFSALLWSGIYLIIGAIVGFFCSLILSAFVTSWFVGALGYFLPLIGIAWILFPKLDPTLNIAMHAVLALLILISSKKSFNKKERDNRQLRVSSDLQTLLIDYDLEALDSDLCDMLDEAVYDRMDIHAKIYLSNNHDELLEGIGVLEDVDEALCILLKQAKTIMQFRERVRRAEKEDSGASSDEQLQSKLNEQMHQFTQKKTVLHELTLDVLQIDNEQIAMGIQALQNKRAEVAIVDKTRKELR